MARKSDSGPKAADESFEDIAKLSFEQALAELEEIVRRLEKGEIDLDGAIQAYARGAALKRHCEEKLRQAEARVSRINLADDGTVRAEPFAPDDGSGH
jgi:exodeoxyribonuclease VII small subunit